MKKVLVGLCLVSSFAIAGSNPFADTYSVDFEGGSYAASVRATDVELLNPAAAQLHTAALALVEGNITAEGKLNYINAFPQDFPTFLSVFHPPAFDQLYEHSMIYIDALASLAYVYPDEVGQLWVNLAAGACLDADAPNYLQDHVITFSEQYPAEYQQHLNRLDEDQQANVVKFLSASLLATASSDGLCSL